MSIYTYTHIYTRCLGRGPWPSAPGGDGWDVRSVVALEYIYIYIYIERERDIESMQ